MEKSKDNTFTPEGGGRTMLQSGRQGHKGTGDGSVTLAAPGISRTSGTERTFNKNTDPFSSKQLTHPYLWESGCVRERSVACLV